MDPKANISIESKVKKFYNFISLLTVEPYLFAFTFVNNVKNVPIEQLIQDKICRYTYGLSANYCTQLPTMSATDDYLGMKSQILSDGTTFTIYQTVILTVPSLVAALFIGSWTDTYIKAKKYVLIAGSIASICEAVVLVLSAYYFESTHYVVLISLLPNVFTGGLLSLLSAVWSYIASTTPPNMRTLRMTVAEFTIGIAQPLGTYVGGLILNTQSIFSSGQQLHNYETVFLLSALIFILALIWTVYMVDEERDVKKWESKFTAQSTTPGTTLHKFEATRHIHPIKLLLNTNNCKEMFKTCFKRRDHYVRLQIWLLFLSMTCFMLSRAGPVVFMFQFSQKIYSWDSGVYSNASALWSLTTSLATLSIAPILLKVFYLKDTTVSIIGLISYLSQNLIRGLMLSAKGFFYSLIPGCLGSVASIGMRSLFSKLIGPQELGKIFSCIGCLEAVTPLIASAVFNTIFNATMDSTPGLTLILVAVILVIPIVILICIHKYSPVPHMCVIRQTYIDSSVDNTVDNI